MTVRILGGHCLDVLRTLPDESVQACVTSPPYFQLRAYGTEPQVWGGWACTALEENGDHEWGSESQSGQRLRNGQSDSLVFHNGPKKEVVLHPSTGAFCRCGAWRGELGQEPTPELFVSHLVDVFREVRRVLKPNGVLLLNIGDSYVGSGKGPSNSFQSEASQIGPSAQKRNPAQFANGQAPTVWSPIPSGYKAKDLYGIPWMVAFALRADGWWLRGDYIWAKPAPMPESVTDRCTRSHEYVFHLTKSSRYFWNQEAIREGFAVSSVARLKQDVESQAGSVRANGGAKANGTMRAVGDLEYGANKRSVWTINTAGYAEAHFATFPPALAELMVKATTRPGDTVLDPFGGAGTTVLEADRHGRHGISIELRPEYAAMQEQRITRDAPLFAAMEVA